MELITALATISLFSFFYYLGIDKEDLVFELLGSLGFLIFGLVIFASQIQAFSIDPITTTIISNVTGNFTSTSYALNLKTVPTTEVFGFILFIIGVFLLFYAGRTILGVKKEGIQG